MLMTTLNQSQHDTALTTNVTSKMQHIQSETGYSGFKNVGF